MTIEALLLDLDRTLVDVQTYTDYEEACRHLEQELGAVELIDVPESGWRSATHQAMSTLSSLAPDPPAWARADEIISINVQQELKRRAPMSTHTSKQGR